MLQISAKDAQKVDFLSELISFCNILRTAERMPNLTQFLHSFSSSDEIKKEVHAAEFSK